MSEEIVAEATEAEVVAAPVEDTPLEAVEAALEAELVVDEPIVAEEDVVTPEAEIVNAAKSLLATVNKFSKVDYEAAVAALGNLIIVEAEQMKEGHDERASLASLLNAVHSLTIWYEGEVAEGEVAGEGAEESLEGEVIEMSVEVEICDDCGEEMKMCKCMKSADKAAAPAINLVVDEADMAGILEKAVASAKAAVNEEITLLKSAQEAALQKASDLEAELATALTKAATGGPKRSAAKETDSRIISGFIQKSAEYSFKAASTQDKILAEGYRELAEDFKLKAAQAAGKEA